MSKSVQDSLYQMILKGLKVLFALFDKLGVVKLDIDTFFNAMDKDEDEVEAE